ncbi:MAG: amidohydrolase [Candidatus Rifleibacteriota bacterium]
MLVLNGMILKTGYQLPYPTGPNVKAIDLKGAPVFAAFSDAHVHFTQTGITRLGCDLGDVDSLSGIFDKIKTELNRSEIALAFNLQEHVLLEKRLPTSSELDKLSTKKFIWIARKDLHSAVLNSAALNWAKKAVANLEHHEGFISGENYNKLSYLLINELPDQLLIKGMMTAAHECLAKGVTFIHAMEGSDSSIREALLTKKIFENSKLDGVVYHQSTDPGFALKNNYPGFGGCLLVDGSFGTRTAALSQPYNDAPNHTGHLYMSPDQIESLLKTARNTGLQLALHAIGDRAIEEVTSTYVWAMNKYQKQDLPDRIEHFILPSTKAIRAAKTADAMICIQPAFDFYWGGKRGLYAERLGPERAEQCNPFKTLSDLGISLACGSDSPVTPIDPILSLHAMVNHTNTEERLSLNRALSLCITEPHRFIGKEKTRGHLKTGFKADFICLSDDPFLVPAARIRTLEVVRTFVGGKEVQDHN